VKLMSTTPRADTSPPSTVAALIEEARKNPVNWVIPGVLLESGVHILHGKEESFKTMLTLQMHEVLSVGGSFLTHTVKGGLRTGIVELETKPRLFGNRLAQFFRNEAPPIEVLPEDLRHVVLNGKQAKDRIQVIREWASRLGLDLVSIDSAVKLFPANCDLSKPEQASEVFNQLQRLPTLWMLAHDRKGLCGGEQQHVGNEEIVGSGRFAQDPDVVHQMVRPDRRAPMVTFNWGKVRDGEKRDPLELWFDKIDFRLYPIHPYIHLLRGGTKSEAEVVAEAEGRYGWKERRARGYIASLLKLTDAGGSPAITQKQEGHQKSLTLVAEPVAAEAGGNDPET
jgi:hypothetical protein